MPGPACAIELRPQFPHIDKRRAAARVHLLRGGRKQQFHPGGLKQLSIPLERPGIALEVFPRRKLRRIHEQGRRNDSAGRPRTLDEGQMTGVQRAHGRNEPKRSRRLRAHGAKCRPHDCDGGQNLHRALLFVIP
jgi:hypothetical protein